MGQRRSRGDVGNIGSHPIVEGRKAEEPEIIEIRAVLRTYASPAVWAAYERADEANAAFWSALQNLASAHSMNELRKQQLVEAAVGDNPAPDSGYHDALEVMYERRTQARAADDALFDAINRELGWRPDLRKRPGSTTPPTGPDRG